MELKVIVERLVEALIKVDTKTTTIHESRSGSGAYLPCVGTIWEDDFTREAIIEWNDNHPKDFLEFSKDWLEVKYPKKRRKCE